MKPVFKLTGSVLMAIMVVIPAKSQELEINAKTKKYFAENVIAVESISKDTLFKKTLKWIYKKYPETGSKGTYVKVEKDRIITPQFFNPDPYNTWGLTNLKIGFNLTYEFKDRKFKYSYSDFYYFSSGEGKVLFESQKFQNYDQVMRDRMLKETNEFIKNATVELISYLQNNKTESKW